MSRYEYIDSCRNDPSELNPVIKMCAWLLVSTSGFYHWLSRPQSATAARREALTARVEVFFKASDGTYGYRRIHADLADEGTECSPELVRQIMRTQGLIACQPRPFRVTTEANEEAAKDMPDLVGRNFTRTVLIPSGSTRTSPRRPEATGRLATSAASRSPCRSRQPKLTKDIPK